MDWLAQLAAAAGPEDSEDFDLFVIVEGAPEPVFLDRLQAGSEWEAVARAEGAITGYRREHPEAALERAELREHANRPCRPGVEVQVPSRRGVSPPPPAAQPCAAV